MTEHPQRERARVSEMVTNPIWIPMRVAWLITGVLPLYFLLQGSWLIAFGFYSVVFLPISMFCDWIEKPQQGTGEVKG